MARPKEPDSATSVIQSAMESNPDVTVGELVSILKQKSLQVSRQYIHTARNRFWAKHPEKKPKARRPDYEATYDNTLRNQAERTLKRFCIANGTGISYSFFGSLDEANQQFLLGELAEMRDSVTVSVWLASLITDARLDKEELEETKKRVKSWQTET